MEWISRLFKSEIREGQAHPDFVFVKADEKTNNIKIEQIRDLIWKLSLKPAAAPLKAAVIDGSHLMTADSQNCLLKTLEEPGGRTLIILIAQNQRLLLPTIVSRCETVKFNFVPDSEISDFLKKEYSSKSGIADIDEITRLSFGRPGRAVGFISDPAEFDNWKNEIQHLACAVSGGMGERFKYVKNISEQKNIEEILEIWSFYFRSLMLQELKPNKALKPAAEAPKTFQFSRPAASQSRLAKIVGTLKKIQELDYILSATNVNEKLALESLMLEI